MKKSEKRERAIEKMKVTVIKTHKGPQTLFDLIEAGVKYNVEYFNFKEVKTPKELRSVNNPTMVADVVHDYGLIFKDGFEIRHVDKDVWNYARGELKRVRERKW